MLYLKPFCFTFGLRTFSCQSLMLSDIQTPPTITPKVNLFQSFDGWSDIQTPPTTTPKLQI